jgi:hypothetical protein
VRRIGVVVSLVSLVLVAIALPTRAAFADSPCMAINADGDHVIVPCQGGEHTGNGQGSGVTYDPDDLVTAVSQVDGKTCTILATKTSPQGEAAVTFDSLLGSIPIFGQPLQTIWRWIVDAMPGCPSLQPTPRAVAWSFVRAAAPPRSEPAIAPGYAITGKKAYLETHGKTSDPRTFDTVLGPLTITFDAVNYTIDWGDASGLDRGPFPLPGQPFPDGKATHTYTSARPVDVVMKTAWSANWSVAGESGRLDGLTRTERIDAFDVRQLQAVRNR